MNPESLLAHHDFVRALAGHLIRDASRADDVAQETWLKALKAEPPERGRLRAWLGRILRNVLRDERRSAAARERREERRPVPLVPSTADVVEREAVRREIVEAVLSLGEPYRDAILLRFYEMLPPRTIASRLGVPVETVRTRIKRGLEQLRTRLAPLARGSAGWPRACAALARPRLESGSAGALEAVVTTGFAMKTTLKVTAAALLLVLISGVATLSWPDLIGGSKNPKAPRAPHSTATTAAEAPGPSAPEGAPAAPEIEPQPSHAFLGQVVDEAGSPVGGARVVAHAVSAPARFGPGAPPLLGDSAASAADGRFRIPVASPPATRRVFVEADGFSPGVVDALAGEPVRIVLDRGRAIFGTVHDAQERPIAGAQVKVAGLIGPMRVERTTTSAADGTYRVDGIAGDRIRKAEWRNWCVVASAPGFAPLYASADTLLKSSDREVRFDPYLVVGATVKGKVVDAETGTPIGGATVFLWSAEGVDFDHLDTNSNPYCPRPLGRATADAAGGFSFSNVPAEGPLALETCLGVAAGPVAAQVGAAPPGYCPSTASIVVSPDGARVEATIKCWPAATVQGRVVDEAGAPVAGASIWSNSGEGRNAHQLPGFCEGAESSSATAAADGKYVMRAVAGTRGSASEVTIGARRTVPPLGGATVKVSVRAGETTAGPDLVIRRGDSALVVVTVKSPSGAPIAGARLRPTGEADAQGRWVTEQDGTALFAFRASGLRETRFLVQATGFASAMSPPFTPNALESIAVNVVLDPGHRVTGRAQWKNGEPAAVAIYALDPGANAEEVLPWLYGKPHHSQVPAPYTAALTQADGSFELRVPAGAPQQLLGPCMAAGTPAILAIPADARDVAFVFPDDRPAPPAGGTVEGAVVEEGTGAPVIRFTAKLVAQDTERRARRVGPGSFRASSIPPGRWRLKVIPDDRAPVEQDVEIVDGKTESVVMKVSSGVTLKGRIVPSGSLRLDAGFLILTPRGSKDEHLGRIRADGTFDITGLRPGAYSARFLPWDPMGTQGVWVIDGPSDLELSAASVQEREFRVTKGGTIHVHVRSGKVIDLWRRKDTLTGDEKAAFAKSLFEIRDSSGRVVASATGFQQTSFSLTLGSYEVLVDVPGAKLRTERVVLNQDEVTVPFDF